MKLLKITALIVFISAVLIIGFIYLARFLPSSDRRVISEIPGGTGLKGVALKLEREGVVRNDKLFILYVLLKGYESGLKAGEYEFLPGISLSEVVDKLVRGDVLIRKFTVPEGLTVDQIGSLLEKSNVMSKEAFSEKADEGEFAKRLIGSSVSSFEGYLFPETYSYTKGIAPEELIRNMVSEFRRVYASLKPKGGKVLNLTEHEIVTLASIVEKETGAGFERPLISAVFHNRLKRGMRLDSDPTVIYGLGSSFDGNLRKRDLMSDNAYNTYKITELPPGPIANPGRDSIHAVLNPANVDYLYFVSKGDGTHQFSINYRDHRRAVIKYQMRRRASGKRE